MNRETEKFYKRRNTADDIAGVLMALWLLPLIAVFVIMIFA